MLIPKRRPTAPGTILQQHYLIPRTITISGFADLVECSRKHMSKIINGKVRIEAKMAVKIAKVLDTTPTFWLNLQNAVDLFDAERDMDGWQPESQLLSA